MTEDFYFKTALTVVTPPKEWPEMIGFDKSKRWRTESRNFSSRKWRFSETKSWIRD